MNGELSKFTEYSVNSAGEFWEYSEDSKLWELSEYCKSFYSRLFIYGNFANTAAPWQVFRILQH